VQTTCRRRSGMFGTLSRKPQGHMGRGIRSTRRLSLDTTYAGPPATAGYCLCARSG
jgi:hypothetical protein